MTAQSRRSPGDGEERRGTVIIGGGRPSCSFTLPRVSAFRVVLLLLLGTLARAHKVHVASTSGAPASSLHRHGRNMLGEPTEWDADGDGLSDEDELRYNTDPHKADTDGDGLNDWEEINVYRTDPLRADSDGDGLNDFDELFKYSTNPMLTDSDQDGVDDGAEVRAGARAKEA